MTLPALANAELAVMEFLWSRDRCTAREIQDALYPDAKRPQHGTVQKLLKRLESKGFVRRDKSLAVHLFSALITRSEYAVGQLESLAEKLTGGSLAPMITRMVEEERLSKEEIDRLRRILEEA